MSTAGLQRHPRHAVTMPITLCAPNAAPVAMPLENISLGGLFVCTHAFSAPGASLTFALRKPSASSVDTIAISARVVHVLDDAAALEKSHPPGMGVRFEPLAPRSQALLKLLVDDLAAAAARSRMVIPGARITDADTVVVNAERAALASLWHAGLSRGGLFAEGPPPPLGSRVNVVMWPLVVSAEVVHVEPGRGAGLHIHDLFAEKRVALQRFIDGEAATIEVVGPAATGVPLAKVMSLVKRLFDGLDVGDPFGAVGLPPMARPEEVPERIRALTELFAAPPLDASIPQRARIERARLATERLEDPLRARAIALHSGAPLSTEKKGDVQARAYAENAAALEARGDAEAARDVMERAVALAPDNTELKKRLTKLDAVTDPNKALDMLERAHVFAAGVGMKKEAVRLAREALALCANREVRLRVVTVLARCGELKAALAICDELLALNARDPQALRAAFTLHEKQQAWALAARAGEVLVKLERNDAELAARVRRASQLARKR